MLKTEEMIHLLANIPLFQGLSNRQLKQITGRCVYRTYEADQAIVSQGKGGFGMFVIISGNADVVLELTDGSKSVVNEFCPTDYFGEVSMLDGGPRTASVIAREKTECLVLGRIEFISLMHNDAELATEIAVTMAKRLRRALSTV